MVVKSKYGEKFDINKLTHYKIASKIEHHETFSKVWEELNKGSLVWIFPEGWSHDLSALLPFKPGVAKIGFEALTKFKNIQINYVWWGLKYSKPSRLRSKVVVEFSDPFTISKQLLTEYEINKASACYQLLHSLELNLRSVAFTAPSHKELVWIYMARRLLFTRTTIKTLNKINFNLKYCTLVYTINSVFFER